jgi:hypothetical protein
MISVQTTLYDMAFPCPSSRTMREPFTPSLLSRERARNTTLALWARWQSTERGMGRDGRSSRMGFPKNVHTCVLRHAMAADHLSPSGVYFGTTTGEILGTSDGGDSWSLMARGIGRVQGISSFTL